MLGLWLSPLTTIRIQPSLKAKKIVAWGEALRDPREIIKMRRDSEGVEHIAVFRFVGSLEATRFIDAQ